MGKNFNQQFKKELSKFVTENNHGKRHDMIRNLYIKKGYTKHNSILMLDYAFIVFFVLYSLFTIFCLIYYRVNVYHCMLCLPYMACMVSMTIKEKDVGGFCTQLSYIFYTKKTLTKILFNHELVTDSLIKALNKDYPAGTGDAVIQYLTEFGKIAITNERIFEFLKSPTSEDISFRNNINNFTLNLNAKMHELENAKTALTERHVLKGVVNVQPDLTSMKKIERL